MIKIKTEELEALIEEETSTMRSLPHYSQFNTVIGEVNGQVVVLTIMNKETACDNFNGNDYINLNLVNKIEEHE